MYNMQSNYILYTIIHYFAINKFLAETAVLINGFCNSEIVEQHAAAGSPDAVKCLFQYSLPGYAWDGNSMRRCCKRL
jgi:hypothetical protein